MRPLLAGSPPRSGSPWITLATGARFTSSVNSRSLPPSLCLSVCLSFAIYAHTLAQVRPLGKNERGQGWGKGWGGVNRTDWHSRRTQTCAGMPWISPYSRGASCRRVGGWEDEYVFVSLEVPKSETRASLRSEPPIVVLHLVTQTDCTWHARETRGDSCQLTRWRVHFELLGPAFRAMKGGNECQITRQSIAAVHEVFLLVSHSRQLLTSLRL